MRGRPYSSPFILPPSSFCLRLAAGGPAPLLAAEVRGEQLLGAVATALVLILGFREEGDQLLIALLLGVGDVHGRGLGPLKRVVDDAHEVIRDVARPRIALTVVTSLC